MAFFYFHSKPLPFSGMAIPVGFLCLSTPTHPLFANGSFLVPMATT